MELNASSSEKLRVNLVLLCDPLFLFHQGSQWKHKVTPRIQTYLREETFKRFNPLVKAASALATSI